MDINAASLEALRQQVMLDWQKGLVNPTLEDLSFLCSDFPSSTEANFYAWLEKIPGFREWVGDRVFQNVRSAKFVVLNRDWEDSVSMSRNSILDDTFGIYSPLVTMMSAAWIQKKFDLVIDVLKTNPVTFTGKAMFATDHKYGNNTIANLTDQALSATTFNAAFTAAAEWKFSNNELCRTTFTHLVHGPKLRATAFSIVDAQFHVSGNSQVDNPNFKRVKRVELPDLAGAADDFWMLVDGSKPIKAIARQIREEATPLMDTTPATVMRLGRFDVMANGRAAAAPTYPHLIYGGVL
jgi:phage major head subunit gpT-like protein